MKRRLLFVSALLLILLGAASCRHNKQMPKSSCAGNTRAGEASAYDPVKDSLRIDSLFDTVWRLECAVALNPRDRKKQKNLNEKSIDTCAGYFYIVGKALNNPDLSDDARPAARKAAAKIAADKWAYFLKSQTEGDPIPLGTTPVSGRVLYKKELRERAAGDTLLVFMMVPVGSVVLQGR